MAGLDQFQQGLAQRSIRRIWPIICFFCQHLKDFFFLSPNAKHVFLQEIIVLPSQLTAFQRKQGEFEINDTRLLVKERERGKEKTIERLKLRSLKSNPFCAQLKTFSLLKSWHFTTGGGTRALNLPGVFTCLGCQSGSGAASRSECFKKRR